MSVASVLLWFGCRPPLPASLPPPPLAPPQSPGEALWAQRHVAADLEAALSFYAEQVATHPTDRQALERLTWGWLLWADAHATDEVAAVAARQAALEWGERCLQLNEAYAAARQKARLSGDAIAATLNPEDVGCAYWAGLARAAWLDSQGASTAERHRDTVRALMARVTQLSPAFFHAGPDRFWGMYYATLPDYAGQDTQVAQQHFERARELAPDYLGTTVDMAEYWAVSIGDQTAFADLLGGVLATNPSMPESLRAENELAWRRAQLLQTQHIDLFRD